MLCSISILPSGDYQVNVYLRDETGYGRWCPLRNFRTEGHAIQFEQEDVPKFSDAELKNFIRTYKEDNIYKRNGYKKYVKYE